MIENPILFPKPPIASLPIEKAYPAAAHHCRESEPAEDRCGSKEKSADTGAGGCPAYNLRK
jgi:hypothetical protein